MAIGAVLHARALQHSADVIMAGFTGHGIGSKLVGWVAGQAVGLNCPCGLQGLLAVAGKARQLLALEFHPVVFHVAVEATRVGVSHCAGFIRVAGLAGFHL